MIIKYIFALSLFIASSGYAYASCQYNGSTYPDGSEVGPYICSNGEWVEK